MLTWYTKDANGLYGPYSLDDLVNLAKEKRITPATLVRRRDSNSWNPASQVKGIFAETVCQKTPSPGAPPPLPKSPQSASREIASSKLTPSRKDSAASPTFGAKTVDKSRATAAPSDSKLQHAIESTTKAVKSSPLGMPFFLWAIIASAGLLLVVLGIRIISGNGVTSEVEIAATTNNAKQSAEERNSKKAATTKEPEQDSTEPTHAKVTSVENASPPAKIASAASNAPSAANKEAKASALSTEDIVTRTEPSVALIQGSSGSGTGFIVKPGIVVTNKHVVQNQLLNTLSVHFPSAEVAQQGPFRPTLLYESPDRDIAFLSIESPLPLLQVAEEYVFRRGQEVIVIGSPGLGDQVLLQNAISRGIMSTKTSIEGKDYYQLGISINPGNSGGPAIDMTGKVVGVVTLGASKKQGLGFCIPPDQLLKEMDSLKSVTPETIAKVQSMHRARVVFLRVHAAARIYKNGMEAYTGAMQIALEKRVSVNVGLKAVREDLEPRLSRIDSLIVADIKRDVGQLGADVHLSDAARQRLVDLWTNYQELKGYVDNPRGNFDSYNMKLIDLADKHKQAAEALRLLLGVEPDDDD